MKLSKEQGEKILNTYPHSVIKPSNEFSIFNPDVFFHKGGYVYEIFISTNVEEKDPNLLLKRLYFSKVISIPNTITVLHTKCEALLNNQFLKKCFDLSLSNLGDAEIKAISKCKQTNRISPDIKKTYFDRFFLNYDLFINNVCDAGGVGKLNFEGQGEIQSVVTPWIGDKKRKLNNAASMSNIVVADRSQNCNCFVSSMNSLISYLLFDRIRVEDGCFYLSERQERFMNYVNVDLQKYAQSETRIWEYAKTLMFAGLLPVKAQSIKQVIDFENKIGKFYGER